MSQLKKPGGVYLRVLYDYAYKGHDDQPVKIKTGEECLLLKKTTPEWWYVIRNGEKKPVYVPANYMEEIHKTIIQVDNGPQGNKKQPPRTAPKPSRPAPTPQPRTSSVPAKKKGPPPKPPAKPVVRKESDEEEVLKQLDNILEHAFDFESLPIDEDNGGESSSGTNSKSNSLQRGAELINDSPVSSTSNSRTGSLQRGENLQNVDTDVKTENGVSAAGDQAKHSKDNERLTPDEPEPDYDEEDEGNSSPSTGREPRKDINSPNTELMGDSGISEGSMECLDKETDSAENSLERNKEKSRELPDYENIGNIQRMLQDDKDDGMPDYANIADIQALIHVDPPPSQPPPDTQPIEVSDGWEMYKEPVTQRFYFYNPETKSSTWIKPKVKADNRDSVFIHNDVIPSDSNEEKAGQPNILPDGWKKGKTDKGDVIFVNEQNTQTWKRSSDTSGKVYFYNEQTGDAKWELPEEGKKNTGLPRTKYSAYVKLHTLKIQRQRSPKVPVRHTPLRNHHHVLLNHKQQRASWAPGDAYVPNLDGSLKAAGMPFIKLAIPGMVSPPSRTSKDITENEEDLEESKDQLVDSLERKTNPSDFTNPRKFMRQSSSPAALESKYSEISTPRPELQKYYSEHHEYYARLAELGKLQEKQGMMKVAKVLENGKKSKKNWSQQYVSVKGGIVFIYKDQKSAMPKSSLPNGKPEGQLELKRAQVEFGKKDISSKKNVIQLTTSTETQYLFQLDDATKMNEWYAVFRENIDQISEPLATSVPELNELRSSYGEDKKTDDTTSTLQSSKGKKSSSKSSTLERESTSADDTEKSSNIKQILKKWIYSRPTVDSLRKKGIYKDAVFGSHLHRVCDKDACNIPNFVSTCINAIERRGLTSDGIYRISGNLAQVQKLRVSVDSGSPYDLDNPEWEIHVLTGALKLFFRELSEPLIPYSFYDNFTAATQVAKDSKKKTFRDLIKTLPPSNRETLKVLIIHLSNVTELSKQNRMQVQNLAIVWGPTLMKPEESAGNEVAIAMVQSGQVIEYILQNCQFLF